MRRATIRFRSSHEDAVQLQHVLDPLLVLCMMAGEVKNVVRLRKSVEWESGMCSREVKKIKQSEHSFPLSLSLAAYVSWEASERERES